MDTLKWKACSSRPGEVSRKGRGMAPPTLLTTRSSRPKASLGLLDQPGHRLEVAQVGGDHHRPPPGGLDLAGHARQLVGGPGRDDHVGPGLGQADGGGRTDARARPR